MPDVHFHGVYATLPDGSPFPGVANPANGRHATIRTMQAQLTSTRLFNENHFAFLAALDDAVARGVRIIALPGDFSDDGQPVHLRGLARILDRYANEHGIRFLALPGNHDPVRPRDRPGGKPDFLGADAHGNPGVPQAIYSRNGNADCSGGWTGAVARAGASWCTDDIRMLGYAGISALLGAHGFSPAPGDRYFETPFSDYAYADYDYPLALRQAGWERRRQRICGGPDADICRMVEDASYLVEPVDGVWLVGLDANVYVPTGPGPGDFTGSGNQGYNAVLRHKPHLIEWLADVVARGEAMGKQVVAFSHYPMTEFFNGASDDIAALMGDGAMQLARRPDAATTRALAATGIRLHIGGHMHIGDVAVHDAGDGNLLVNIQAPSLAAYAPGYTLLTLHGDGLAEVRTVRMDEVPRFDELFALYRAEHARGAPWDAAILGAVDYGDMASRYLRELVRLRLLDDDWPCDMRELVRSPLSGADLLVFSQLHTGTTLAGLERTPGRGGLSEAFFACTGSGQREPAATADDSFTLDLARARERAAGQAADHGFTLDDFAGWEAMDLAVDFVRLANAGELAFDDIPAARLAQYRVLAAALDPAGLPEAAEAPAPDNPGDLFRARFAPLMRIMATLAGGAPSRHILIDLEEGRVQDPGQPGTRASFLGK